MMRRMVETVSDWYLQDAEWLRTQWPMGMLMSMVQQEERSTRRWYQSGRIIRFSAAGRQEKLMRPHISPFI
jgi:hypothetical protein